MKGVILSGGKGSRLSPITDNYPKQLIPILGKPILVHCIDSLRQADISEICIIISPETGPVIQRELQNYNFDCQISFIVQDEPKGLAHAINLSKDFVAGDDFTVLLGDNLFDKTLDELISTFYQTKSDSLILLKEVDRPYDFGVVKFDANGKAEKIVEKPKEMISKYAIVGVYIFSPIIFDFIAKINPSQRGELEITDAVALQVAEGKDVHTSILSSYWFDSGTREGLLDANKRYLIAAKKFDNINSNIRDSYLLGNIALGEGSCIENSNLMGPISIGKNTKVINSVVGPYTTIADNCVIRNAELQETVVMQNTGITNSHVTSSLIFKDLDLKDEELIINKLVAEGSL